MNTQNTIARLASELASWEADLTRKQALVKGYQFPTKKDERYAMIEIADYQKVVEGKRKQLAQHIGKQS